MKRLISLLTLAILTLILIGTQVQDEIDFTPEEIQWMKENPVIRVAPDNNYGPIEYLDDDGVLKGASVDYLSWIEEKTDLTIELVVIETWPEIMEAIRNREVDILSAATKTEQREEFLLFTEPYISVPNVIITRLDAKSNLVLDDLVGEEVVVLSDYAIEDYLEFYYSSINLVPVVTMDEGLSLVSFGTKDYMVVSIAQVSYYIKEKAITNLKVSGESGFENELSIAVRDDWPMLRRILNKTLKAMPNREHDRIFNKWVNIEGNEFLSKTTIYAILIVLCLSLMVLVLILIFNKVLRSRVEERTALYKNELKERQKVEDELESLNDTLELKVIERTEALSQAIEDMKKLQGKLIETEKMASLGRVVIGVSHQLNTPIGTSISLTSFIQKKQLELCNTLEDGSLSKEGLVKFLEEASDATDLIADELDRARTFIEHFKELKANSFHEEKKHINVKGYLSTIVGMHKGQLKEKNIIVECLCEDDLMIFTSLGCLNNIFNNLISNSIKHGFINTSEGRIEIQISCIDKEVKINYKDNGVGIESELLESVYEPLFTTSMGTSTGLGLNILYNTVVTSLHGSLDLVSNLGEGVHFIIKFMESEEEEI